MTPVKVTIEFTFDLDKWFGCNRENVHAYISDCISGLAPWPVKDPTNVKITSTFDTSVEN